jgi:hypothetical protein
MQPFSDNVKPAEHDKHIEIFDAEHLLQLAPHFIQTPVVISSTYPVPILEQLEKQLPL